MSKNSLDVSYVAELSRLELTDSEKVLFQKQLDDIMEYVNKVSSVDVEGVEPTMNGLDLVNVFRDDVVRPSLDRELALANAPARTNEEFKLPKIVEDAES